MYKVESHRILKPLIIILFFGLSLTACKKEVDDPVENNTPPKLSVSNFSPGLTEAVLQIEGFNGETAVKYLDYADYQTITNGKKELSIKLKNQQNVLTKTTFDFKLSTHYSLFITDVLDKTSLLITEDDLTNPNTGKAKIRFINLNPDAGNLDFNVKSKQALFSDMKFKSITKYEQMDAANEVIFEIRLHGKPEVIASTSTLKIESGKIYTILAKGLYNTSDDYKKFGLSVLTNK